MKIRSFFLLPFLFCPLFSLSNQEVKLPVDKEGLNDRGEIAFLLEPGTKVVDVRKALSGMGFEHIGFLPVPGMAVCFLGESLDSISYLDKLSTIRSYGFFKGYCPTYTTPNGTTVRMLPELFVKLESSLFIDHLQKFAAESDLVFEGPLSGFKDCFRLSMKDQLEIDSRSLALVMEQFDWIEFVQPNMVFNPSVSSVNDPLFNRQWSLENDGSALQYNGTVGADISLVDAWNITTGDSAIKVAVIDSGVDTLHPDLIENLLHGFDAVSDSTDGYPTPNYPQDGHGTACSGIIGAKGNNQIGVAGIAYNCSIIPIRSFYYTVLSPGIGVQPFSTPEALALATDWAWRNGADVMSNSWSLTPDFEQLFQAYLPLYAQAVQLAVDSGRNGLGVPMFYSSGNEDADFANWPARIEGTISVGATSMCDERKSAGDCSPETWGGNYGANLDFSAPGVRIPSTDMIGSLGYNSTDNTSTFNGTSAACPHAAGVAALMLSVNPALSAYAVRMIMSRSCDRVGAYPYDSLYSGGTWSQELGFGRINAYKAVQESMTFSDVGILDEPDKPFKLFPNPNDGVFVLMSKEPIEGQILIFDLQGKLVREAEMTGIKADIDISDLSSGGYMVFVQTGEKVIEAGTIQKR